MLAPLAKRAIPGVRADRALRLVAALRRSCARYLMTGDLAPYRDRIASLSRRAEALGIKDEFHALWCAYVRAALGGAP